jgi:hypothetical protein
MTPKTFTAILLCVALFACAAQAAPVLSVTSLGFDPGTSHSWLVQITPDSPPSSMAVELAFAIDDAELLDVDVNTAAWDRENPGLNPFTGTLTEGLWFSLIDDQTYGAFGSIVFSSTDPVELFTIKTSNDLPQTIRYGTAASGDPVLGARICQHGTNYDGYTGSVTVPEPASSLLMLAALAMLAGWRRRS